LSIQSAERGTGHDLPIAHDGPLHPRAAQARRSIGSLSASVSVALSLLLLLSLSACRDAPLDGATSGLFRPLAEISDVKAGMPVLVFVYTDG